MVFCGSLFTGITQPIGGKLTNEVDEVIRKTDVDQFRNVLPSSELETGFQPRCGREPGMGKFPHRRFLAGPKEYQPLPRDDKTAAQLCFAPLLFLFTGRVRVE
jgi:hypothetical protein